MFTENMSIINKIFCKSSENMEEVPNNSVHLMITSPPYNVGKEYEEEILDVDEYRYFLTRVFSEVRRVLVSGGRACINIANTGRNPYVPLSAHITEDMLSLGFSMRGDIIWDKGVSAGNSTSWGSWRSASNPTLRDVHEYILVFSKDTLGRERGTDTIKGEEFLKYTKSVWKFPTASASRIGHPAPFPIELAWRLINLYSFENDVILDPFMGSGQTALAALKAKRKYIGYDNVPEYVELAEKRLSVRDLFE